MAAKQATDEVVFQAADALAAEGRSPSANLIRERIGLGGFTTIQAALARWKQVVAQRNAYQVPEEIATQADGFARSLWTAARQQADTVTAGVRQAAELKFVCATAELAEAQAEISRLERELTDVTERASEVEAAFARARQAAIAQATRIEHLQISLEQASSQAACLQKDKEGHAQENAALRARCELLEVQHTRLLATLEKLGVLPVAADGV
jgi:chromosome segregation ATPase